MTEAEWLAGEEPKRLFKFCREGASDRKTRLFLCASARLLWDWYDSPHSREAIEVAERYADGEASARQLLSAHALASTSARSVKCTTVEEWEAGAVRLIELRGAAREVSNAKVSRSASNAINHVFEAGHHVGLERWRAGVRPIPDQEGLGELNTAERVAMCHLMRDVFPGPSRPDAAFDSAWRTPDVVALAEAAYFERLLPSGGLDPHRLWVLGDALEEAGADPAVGAHLRGGAPHVRGCWAVDACLGKG